jgi:hypothetical protein
MLLKAVPLFVGSLVFFFGTSAASALSPEDKCIADKSKLSGKYALCRHVEDARAVKTGLPADYSACDLKLTDGWAKAEQKAATNGSACIDAVDAATAQTFITAHAQALDDALGGDDLPSDVLTCQNELQAALNCQNGVVDPGEDCDFGTLGGADCASLGQFGGTLACAPGCVFDTTGCWTVLLEQLQANTCYGVGTVAAGYADGQSFTAPADGEIGQIDMALQASGGNPLSLAIFEGAGYGGPMLHSQLVTPSYGMGSVTPMESYVLTSPISVISGNVYTIAIARTSNSYNGGYCASSSDVYAGGSIYSGGNAYSPDATFRVIGLP